MKKILFLTGTRADFGKIKSLISITQKSSLFDVHIFATGMHMIDKYGKTVNEIYKSGFENIFEFSNHDVMERMDINLATTITGFSNYVATLKPDLIVIHGDRVEAMAGAIVGSLNNILVAHIEGGELSGTIDELIRHSISKLAHIHLVSNNEAKLRLVQMGENRENIFTIGSPDLDVMNSNKLPALHFVKEYYDIDFKEYALLIFHSVTTELEELSTHATILIDALIKSKRNYIVIYPNNDSGSNIILEEYTKLEKNSHFKIFPSLRFEYFLTLLKNTQFVIGNSSAGLREAPYYSVPTINVGNRQLNRVKSQNIIDIAFDKEQITSAIGSALMVQKKEQDINFGDGKSDTAFYKLLQNESLWNTPHQKQFLDIQ